MYFLTTFKILFSFWAGTEKIFPSLIQPIQLTSMSEVKKKKNTRNTLKPLFLFAIYDPLGMGEQIYMALD